MPYCLNCGKEVDNNQEYCMNCGVALSKPKKEDKGGFLWGLVGFLVPILGLIFFIIWREEKPKTSKAVGIGALVSVILYFLYIVINIIRVVIIVLSSGLLM